MYVNYIVFHTFFQDIMSTGSAKNLRNALNDIKNIMSTPIQAFKELTKTSSKQQEEGGVSNPAGVVGDMRPDSSLSSSDSEQGSMPVQEGDMPGQITRFMGKSKHELQNWAQIYPVTFLIAFQIGSQVLTRGWWEHCGLSVAAHNSLSEDHRFKSHSVCMPLFVHNCLSTQV